MIPSGYKASKLYSVLPTDGTGDFTTTRASVATRVNESGLIEEVAANVPRLDYSDGTCPSLLLEPASTNLVVQSQVFSGYNKGNAVLADNVIISPDGTLNGASFTDDNIGGTGIVQMFESVTVDISSAYTWSIFAKKKDNDFIILRPNAFTTPLSDNSSFDLVNGTVFSEGVGHTAKIENYGNGWYRCSITFTTDAVDTSGSLIARLSTNGSATTLNLDGTNSIYTWGWQFEKNSYATSYIKNAGTALGVTRVADTATGSGNSTVINSSEGVLYAEISALANDGTTRYISLNDGSNSNDVRLYFDSSSYISVLSKVAGTTQVFLQSNSYTQTDFNKIAFKYKENDFALWINGVEVGTDLSGITNSIGTLNQLSFFGNNLPFYGKTKSVQVYTTALTDAELANLTTI